MSAETHGLSFAALLRRHRQAAGLTQEELAERAHLSARAVSDLERGLKITPRRETVTLLADALLLSSAERAELQATIYRPTGILHESDRDDPPARAPSSLTAVPEAPPRNPYKGLLAFTGADTGDFFGRERLVDALITDLSELRTGRPRFLALVGSSGSGKSSVVLAGLLPRLQRGAVAGSEEWIYLEPVLPGAHPVEALAVTLSNSIPGSTLKLLREDLEDSSRGLHLLASRLVQRRSKRVVLVIDQCEELFTLTTDEGERQRFVELLATAVQEPEGPLVGVLTLRADFYDRPLRYPSLVPLLEGHSKLIPPMTVMELRSAITRPAELPDVRLQFEDELVTDLLFEVRDEAGALPLLQYTLDQLYARREGRRLTMSAYRALGGVQGALALQAESTYAALPSDEHRWLARALYLRLIDPGVTEQDTTRRRASMAELVLPDPQQSAHMGEVADAFVGARLLTTNLHAGVTTLEVSHEALIREWARLGDWLREARDGIYLQQRLSEDTAVWQKRDRPADNLYRGLVLDEALAWADRNAPSAAELEFLTAGLDERYRQEAEEQDRQAQRLALAQQAAEANRRAADRLRYLAVVLAVSLLAAVGLTTIALKNAHDAGVAQRAAELGSTLALSRQLAAQSLTNFGDRYDLALLLSVEANRLADTVEARDSVLRGLAYNPRLVTYLHQGAAGQTNVAYSPDGKILASGGCAQTNALGQCLQGEIRFWDAARGRLLGSPLISSGSAILSVAFSPDGKTLASGSFDGSLRLWDVARRSLRAGPFRDRTYRLYTVLFSPDGSTLACGSDLDTIVLWDVRRQRIMGPAFVGSAEAVPSMAFSRDGTYLAVGTYDGETEIYDIQRHRFALDLPPSGTSGGIFSVAFSPNGTLLATGGFDGVVRLWDIARQHPIGQPLSGNAGSVNSMSFNPNGSILAIGSADGSVHLWDMHRHAFSSSLAGNVGNVSSVTFSPDGHTLAAAGVTGAIQVWDIAHWQSLGSALGGSTSGVQSLAYSPDGSLLASGGDDGNISLRDVPRRKLLVSLTTNHSGSSARSVVFSPSSATVAAGLSDGSIQLWDARTRRRIGLPLVGHTGGISSLAFSPDGRILASGSDDKTVRLWRMTDHRALGSPFTGYTYGVTGVAFSPDGAILASVSYDGSIRLWSVSQGRSLGPPFGHTAAILSLAFSPDGRTLATGSQDGSIWLWNVTRRQALGEPLTGHSGGVTSLSFSPDGRVLASASQDLTVRLWEVAGRQALGAPLIGHTANVTSLSFSPDGRTLASGSEDGTIRLSSMDRADWLAQACRIANRDLTEQEWQQHLGGRPYLPACPVPS